ncbi:MAG: hypothetical protein K6F84_01665, partial [Lachnospiraceae bacterium]|nr:hypothetical protein [Lachnospiraceae bacterium]
KGKRRVDMADYTKAVEDYLLKYPTTAWFELVSGMGVNPFSMGVFLESGLNVKAHWKNAGPNTFEIIKKQLSDDIPVPMGIYSMDAKTKGVRLFNDVGGSPVFNNCRASSHYVTVTGVMEDFHGMRRALEISSWGKRMYLDYDEFENFRDGEKTQYRGLKKLINRVGSGILLIKREK